MRNKALIFLPVFISAMLLIMTCYYIADDNSSADLAKINSSSWKVDNNYQRKHIDLKMNEVDGYVELPLTSLGGASGTSAGVLYVNGKYESKFVEAGVEFNFPFPGVPVDLKIINGDWNFAFREIFNGNLFNLVYSHTGELIKQQEIVLDGVDFPIFRASAVGADKLYYVVYDNNLRKNYLMDVGDGISSDRLFLELPSFYPPAGGTYEMEPPIFFSGNAENGFELIAGALYAKINDGEIDSRRLDSCETVIQTLFTPQGAVVLCRARANLASPYYLGMLNSDRFEPLNMSEGVPWRLEYNEEEQRTLVIWAQTREEVAQVFLQDMRNGQNSGVLEFGIDNTEGRIPWSQIYYLNGLMDLLLLADNHEDGEVIFRDMSADVFRRLYIEISALDDLLDRPDGFHTKGFTYDRSAALFAVQTSRLLLLFDRYSEEFPQTPKLRNIEKLRDLVTNLDGHIEQLAYEGEQSHWMKQGTAHLRWPKCSAFYFDGMPVPFNHQNEWAYSLFESARIKGKSADEPKLNDQRDIISFFMDRLAVNGGFPPLDSWNYWYGHPYDGWTEADGRSCNTPVYLGDHGLAWISFRTIDFMSVMSSIDFMPDLNKGVLVRSARETVKRGDVFPFASRSLLVIGEKPEIQKSVLERYYRATAPWEISNSPWALVMGAPNHLKHLSPDVLDE